LLAVFLDEAEGHIASLAKNAVAFFRGTNTMPGGESGDR
jgi:hypothetical protein